MGKAIQLEGMRHALFGTLAAIALVSGCSEDGVTPNCPELSLYPIAELANDGSIDPAIKARREEAAAADCITLEGDATSTGGAGGGPSAADADSD